MRWAVSFKDAYCEGVLVFTAYDLKDAYRIIRENTNFEMATVSAPIPFVGNIDELYRLLSLKRREQKRII